MCIYIYIHTVFFLKGNKLDSPTDDALMEKLIEVKEKRVQVEEKKAEALERIATALEKRIT